MAYGDTEVPVRRINRAIQSDDVKDRFTALGLSSPEEATPGTLSKRIAEYKGEMHKGYADKVDEAIKKTLADKLPVASKEAPVLYQIRYFKKAIEKFLPECDVGKNRRLPTSGKVLPEKLIQKLNQFYRWCLKEDYSDKDTLDTYIETLNTIFACTPALYKAKILADTIREQLPNYDSTTKQYWPAPKEALPEKTVGELNKFLEWEKKQEATIEGLNGALKKVTDQLWYERRGFYNFSKATVGEKLYNKLLELNSKPIGELIGAPTFAAEIQLYFSEVPTDNADYLFEVVSTKLPSFMLAILAAAPPLPEKPLFVESGNEIVLDQIKVEDKNMSFQEDLSLPSLPPPPPEPSFFASSRQSKDAESIPVGTASISATQLKEQAEAIKKKKSADSSLPPPPPPPPEPSFFPSNQKAKSAKSTAVEAASISMTQLIEQGKKLKKTEPNKRPTIFNLETVRKLKQLRNTLKHVDVSHEKAPKKEKTPEEKNKEAHQNFIEQVYNAARKNGGVGNNDSDNESDDWSDDDDMTNSHVEPINPGKVAQTFEESEISSELTDKAFLCQFNSLRISGNSMDVEESKETDEQNDLDRMNISDRSLSRSTSQSFLPIDESPDAKKMPGDRLRNSM